MFALCDEEDFLALPQSAAEGEEERRGEWKLEQRNVEIETGAGRQGRTESRKEVKQAKMML